MQLKGCFLDLVIFSDKAYNLINPTLTLCFNFLWGSKLPSVVVITSWEVQFLNYQFLF